MTKNFFLPAFLVAVFTASLHADVQLLPAAPSAAAFPLVTKAAGAAVICLPANAPKVVQIAARDLAADIERVTGVRATVADTRPAAPRPHIELVLAPAALSGRWEAFQISATADTLTVAGADPRGLAYGIYELSRRIGVSPWYWWADVPVVHRDELRLSLGADPVDQPAVKYRGIFINDEDWGLQPWAAKTFEPEAGTIGPKTYAKICELLLRLKANTLWPAMHECTKAFHLVPGNAAVADSYAIVLGSSHAEPMLRNNVGEWTGDKKLYNYVINRDGVHTYWEQRVKERTSGESLFTLGMRGIHDSPIMGPKTQAERVATLEKIFADQRELLARYLGKGDPTHVAQLFCPYKEVLDDYNAGLKVPADVTLLWPDDNYGYIRRFGTAAEQARSGGLGVYYHASYLGAPLSWLWLDSLPPALVWSEMTRAYEQGARTFWVLNVGDIKNTELSTEFFLDLAWHADRTDVNAPAHYLLARAAREFGAANADPIADIWRRHQALAFARKPEHLQWHLPGTPYTPTALTLDEITRRLDAYAALVKDTEAVAARLPTDAQDAFFELVGFPVQSAAAANRRYFGAELSFIQKARGDAAASAAAYAVCEEGTAAIGTLSLRYNEKTAGGKWRLVVTGNGLSTSAWKKLQPDVLPPLVDVEDPKGPFAKLAKASPVPASPLRAPADARTGDFVERDGVVSIDAGHFTAQADLPGGGWRSIPGLGRTGSAVTVLPSTLKGAPRLSYRFYTTTAAPADLRVRLLPTHPLATGQGLRFAVALDDGAPVPLAVTSGFDPKSDAWKQRVLANATETSGRLSAQLPPGWHTLHLVAVDAGVVVDKFVMDLGGLQPSYDGPPETRAP